MLNQRLVTKQTGADGVLVQKVVLFFKAIIHSELGNKKKSFSVSFSVDDC
jgi:hypothetical protein